jgi:predicted nuclease with TOPRIM domain
MTIQEQLQQRLQSLKTEYATGQNMLADLEAKQAHLRDTLLRISGAIQVLEEMLTEAPEATAPENGGADYPIVPTEVGAIE